MEIKSNSSKSGFDTYMVSSSNEDFFNKAKKVAYDRDGSLNPLFVYGPNMVGKTHLLLAIIDEYKKQGLKTMYLSGEDLTSIICKYCKTEDKKTLKVFEELDLLAIDNAHDFLGKLATQELIAEILSNAVSNKTQVIFVTDRCFGFESTLKRKMMRLPNATYVTVESPDLPLRKRFLNKCLSDEELTVAPESKAFLIKNYGYSLASLQGALKRLLIKSKLEGKEITHEFIVEVLND